MAHATIHEDEQTRPKQDVEPDDEDRRATFDDELELWILASST